jgi:hypothetical protein
MLSHDHSLQSYQKDISYAKRKGMLKKAYSKKGKRKIAHIQGKE